MSIQPKVLVVDDDKNILSVFEDFLNKEHCSLIPAATVHEAMMSLQQQPIDLLIMDLNLKKQPGLTLSKRAKELHKNLPIIMITSYTDLIGEKEAMRYGADYFFPKPLDLGKFRTAVQKCLYGRSRVNY